MKSWIFSFAEEFSFVNDANSPQSSYSGSDAESSECSTLGRRMIRQASTYSTSSDDSLTPGTSTCRQDSASDSASGDSVIPDTPESSTDSASEDDQDPSKLGRRREQNRQAAQRCRQRKRQEASSVLEDYKKYMSTNTEVKHTIRTLEKEKEKLEMVLAHHSTDNSCRLGKPWSEGIKYPANTFIPLHELLAKTDESLTKTDELLTKTAGLKRKRTDDFQWTTDDPSSNTVLVPRDPRPSNRSKGLSKRRTKESKIPRSRSKKRTDSVERLAKIILEESPNETTGEPIVSCSRAVKRDPVIPTVVSYVANCEDSDVDPCFLQEHLNETDGPNTGALCTAPTHLIEPHASNWHQPVGNHDVHSNPFKKPFPVAFRANKHKEFTGSRDTFESSCQTGNRSCDAYDRPIYTNNSCCNDKRQRTMYSTVATGESSPAHNIHYVDNGIMPRPDVNQYTDSAHSTLQSQYIYPTMHQDTGPHHSAQPYYVHQSEQASAHDINMASMLNMSMNLRQDGYSDVLATVASHEANERMINPCTETITVSGYGQFPIPSCATTVHCDMPH